MAKYQPAMFLTGLDTALLMANSTSWSVWTLTIRILLTEAVRSGDPWYYFYVLFTGSSEEWFPGISGGGVTIYTTSIFNYNFNFRLN
jgi:hypothetical protein